MGITSHGSGIGTRDTIAAAIGALAAVALAASMVGAQSAVPSAVVAPSALPSAAAGTSIAPPGSDPLGVPYGDWAGRWWSWLISVPADQSPALTDNCAAGQTGDVLMIPHTTFGNELATTCHITEGQSVLASAGGTFCDDADGTTKTELEMVRCVDLGRNEFLGARITVDGVDVPNIGMHWALSPLTEITYPEGNIFGLPAGTAHGVAGGWFAMISGLEPGTHEIVVHDELIDAGETISAQVTATVEVAAK